eukprot:77072_1
MKTLFKNVRRFCSGNSTFDPKGVVHQFGLKNRDPILNVFKTKIPLISEANDNKTLNILEIGSGSGMHINYFASYFNNDNTHNIIWQPTNRNNETFKQIENNIKAHKNETIIKNPFVLDLNEIDHRMNTPNNIKYDVIFAINVFQVTSMQSWNKLIEHSFYNLMNLDNPNRMLLIYGPFKLDGQYTSESNEQWDKERQGNANKPDYYIKDMTEMNNYANKFSFELSEKIEMPSNNFCLIFTPIHGEYDIDFDFEQ